METILYLIRHAQSHPRGPHKTLLGVEAECEG